ncbi:hypothetical protein [Aureimonas phyllosphaerae]|uniref:Helix-turn-helix domain-containing protein n=1 Tax=Aureimonas phyllosphaerae TaxID=1166078 RepID=A0A7W6FWF2_9HYPH|nr:hypothetical protein [Aureimonas phyllosphaerae]MBB3938163.1 hypothetical protein [Aureimonas phyllosphaerae]MBB3962171.1 hypothetical protein [Aureimonas phyllosphaerae]SFF56563.1 hypothetical protein SAMN05216566_1309 [Aureimonas phyllosphaerae]
MSQTTIRDEHDAHLTIGEAARWADRSEGWVRCYRTSGPLVAVEVNGRQGVTLSSLRDFCNRRPKPRRWPKLRLVVDNTKNKP